MEARTGVQNANVEDDGPPLAARLSGFFMDTNGWRHCYSNSNFQLRVRKQLPSSCKCLHPHNFLRGQP